MPRSPLAGCVHPPNPSKPLSGRLGSIRIFFCRASSIVSLPAELGFMMPPWSLSSCPGDASVHPSVIVCPPPYSLLSAPLSFPCTYIRKYVRLSPSPSDSIFVYISDSEPTEQNLTFLPVPYSRFVPNDEAIIPVTLAELVSSKQPRRCLW